MSLVLIFAMLLAGCLSGCNKKGDSSISVEEIPLEDLHLYSSVNLFEGFQYIYLAEPYENGFYAYASKREEPEKAGLYYCDLANESAKELTYEASDSRPIMSMSSVKNGELWLVEYNQTNIDGIHQEEYQINVCSNNTMTLFEHEKITNSFPVEIIVDDSNGKIYILSTNDKENSAYIYVYSKNGEQLKKVKCTNSIKNIVYSENEKKLFVIENIENIAIISTLDEEDASINEVMRIESTTSGSLFASDTTSVNVDIDSVLMGFDLKSKTFTPIIDVVTNGLPGFVRYAIQYDDNYILIRREASNIDTVVRLSQTSELQGNKTKLKIAAFGSDNLIDLAVANFNKENVGYSIEITDYSVYGENALKRLNLDIASGNSPDIFNMDGLSIKQYISLGVLENLDDYLKQDFNQDEFWESAMSSLYMDDNCYLIVPGFAISSIFGTLENINKIESLDFRELLDYVNENSDEKQNVFGNYMTQMEFIEFMVSCNMDTFINYETKECHFNSDNFIALLDTACKLAPDDADYDETFEIYSGSQPISFQWIRNMADLDLIAAIYQDDFATTGLSGTAENAGALMLPLYSFGMSSQSAHKDGAWQFLKGLYSEDFQQAMQTVIPMRKVSFEAQWDGFKTGLEEEKEDGLTGFTYLKMADGTEMRTEIKYSENRLGCYQNTLDLIDSIDRFYQVDTTVMNIINEELQDCLYGDKSTSDVAASIQSRTNIYMNE